MPIPLTAAHRAEFARLRILDGTWCGRGSGGYPTLEPFAYNETHSFSYDPAYPIIHFVQQVRLLPDQASHWESGFIRILPDGRLEMNNAQDNGRVEVLHGEIVADLASDLHLVFESTAFANDPRMIRTVRTIIVTGNSLHYTMHMATTLTALPEIYPHLQAKLERQP